MKTFVFICIILLLMLSSIIQIHMSESYIYTIINQSFNQSMKIFAFIRLKVIFISSSIIQIHTSESYIYPIINQSINHLTTRPYVWVYYLYYHQLISFISLIILLIPYNTIIVNQSINEIVPFIHTSESYIYTIINQSVAYVWKF